MNPIDPAATQMISKRQSHPTLCDTRPDATSGAHLRRCQCTHDCRDPRGLCPHRPRGTYTMDVLLTKAGWILSDARGRRSGCPVRGHALCPEDKAHVSTATFELSPVPKTRGVYCAASVATLCGLDLDRIFQGTSSWLQR